MNLQAFRVLLSGRDPRIREFSRRPDVKSHIDYEIDVVFYGPRDKVTVDEVRRSLIDHDGYPDSIKVEKV